MKNTETQEIVYVKVRLKTELHQKLKQRGDEEERSMNYLINKAVEQFLRSNAA